VEPGTASPDAGVQGYLPEKMPHPTLIAKLAQFGPHNYVGYTDHASAAIKSAAYPGKNFWMTALTNISVALPELTQAAAAMLVWDGYDSLYNHASLAGRKPTPHDTGNEPALLSNDTATGIYTPRKAVYEHPQLFRYVEVGARGVTATVAHPAVDTFIPSSQHQPDHQGRQK
jgi:hypothetical protein